MLSNDTHTARFGRDGAYYVRKYVGSSGSEGSVLQVMETKTGKSFGAKLPHSDLLDSLGMSQHRWEVLDAEFQKLKSLSHVSYFIQEFIADYRSQDIGERCHCS